MKRLELIDTEKNTAIVVSRDEGARTRWCWIVTYYENWSDAGSCVSVAKEKNFTLTEALKVLKDEMDP